MKNYTFHVVGMHCPSCSILIESELKDIPEVKSVTASLKHHTVEVAGDFGDKTLEHIAKDLSEVLNPHGYSLSPERHRHLVKWNEFVVAIPIAIVFVALFIGLQKLGLINLITTSQVSYGTAFMIGLIASVSTCMAVVGGLVLSMSANFAKEGDKVGPQVLFHVGRLISFFVLGGVIGALGGIFELGGTDTFIVSLIIGLILLILGINLLDIFPWAKKLQPTLPKFIGGHIHGLKSLNHTLTPFLVGVATFFLPCGFTQSMQIYSLSTGNLWVGAITMFVFALGTLPVLALLSFSSLSVRDYKHRGIFFKTAGLIVVFFGVFNLINSFVSAGIINPIFPF